MKTRVLLFLLCSLSLLAKEIHPVTKVNGWFKDEKERTEGRFSKFASLATVSPDGHPHARIVEITHLHPQKGALFFTHQKTEKAEHLSHNPQASLNIHLPRTHRQVSIDGTVSQISSEEAEKAWHRMPRFMKFIFLASNKDASYESREELEKRKKALEKEFPNEVPYPEAFIGYRLKPQRIIFYEVHYRSFPSKAIATLEDNNWNLCQVIP